MKIRFIANRAAVIILLVCANAGWTEQAASDQPAKNPQCIPGTPEEQRTFIATQVLMHLQKNEVDQARAFAQMELDSIVCELSEQLKQLDKDQINERAQIAGNLRSIKRFRTHFPRESKDYSFDDFYLKHARDIGEKADTILSETDQGQSVQQPPSPYAKPEAAE